MCLHYYSDDGRFMFVCNYFKDTTDLYTVKKNFFVGPYVRDGDAVAEIETRLIDDEFDEVNFELNTWTVEVC